MNSAYRIALTTGCALIASTATHASIWNEVGDAGQNGPAQAQITFGDDGLHEIQGTLDPGSDVDVYLIQITDFENFDCYGNGPMDTMLFLFRADGLGQVANDDFRNEGTDTNFGGRLTNQGVFENGFYYIAISRFNNRPLDADNNLVFSDDFWPGPDPQQFRPNESAGAFDHWTGTNNGPGGVYKIRMSGASYAPAPGALALLGLAGLMGTRRRRACDERTAPS